MRLVEYKMCHQHTLWSERHLFIVLFIQVPCDAVSVKMEDVLNLLSASVLQEHEIILVFLLKGQTEHGSLK